MNLKHALITGGASGLGLSLAQQLVRRGVSVTLLDLQDASAAVEKVKAAAVGPARVYAVQANVSEHEQVEAAVRDAERTLGPINFLAASAGVYRDEGTITQSRTDVFTKTVAINYLGVVHSVKAVLPGMLERGHGRILLLSSMQAAIPMSFTAAYSSTKAAVKAFADVLRMETLGSGVNVHVAQPGSVQTPLLDSVNIGGRKIKDLESSPVMARLWGGGTPEPDQVTAAWLKAMDRGVYLLPFTKTPINLLVHMQAGHVAPGVFSWPVDFLLSPVLSLMKTTLRSTIAIMARIVNAENRKIAMPPAAGQKT